MINPDCYRTLLFCIDDYLANSPGKHPKFKMKYNLKNPQLADYNQTEILQAMQYLVDKKLVRPVALKDHPRNYDIISVTAEGNDFITAIKDDTVWKRIKKALPDIAKKSIPEIISAAIDKLLP